MEATLSTPSATTAPVQSTELETMSVRDWFAKMNIKTVQTINGYHVRANSNGYPFICLIDKDNTAHNTYFSKNASELVTKGQVAGKGFFDQFVMGLVDISSTGGKEWKFVTEGTGTRTNVDDLF